ncbi:MAG: class I SAM-dependent methyltransferase [Candidatus Omnitrophica bacterium]|nr:class I SAM-dependent methyltransferase [Candidatus Omnitrophota bacterium]
MRILKVIIKKFFAFFHISVSRICTDKPNPIHLWEEDGAFKNEMKLIEKSTLVDKYCCFMLYQFVKHVATLPGDVAEIGVYKGGTAKLLARGFEPFKKRVHLFDTFAGMPSTDSVKDIHKAGDFNDTSLKSVQKFLQDNKNVSFYQGIFPSTSQPIVNKTFCLVHIDVDIYKSVRDCCVFFYPRMDRGGMMVFDDYGALTCPGAKMAVDEFFADKPEKPFYLPTGQCVVARF